MCVVRINSSGSTDTPGVVGVEHTTGSEERFALKEGSLIQPAEMHLLVISYIIDKK